MKHRHDQLFFKGDAMKGKDMREVQEDYQKKIVGLCIICSKPVPGYYGCWGNGGTCNKYCEDKQESKPKHPPPAESFAGEEYGPID